MGSSLSQPTSPQSEPPWSPPGLRRSTFDLAQACILNLILCSWTAVHPDIPPKNKQHGWTRKKLFCALCAIIAPELFLWMAFDELWESRLICLELKKLESTRAEKTVSSGGNPTTTVHSSPELKDMVVLPADPSRGNPETPCTNDQGNNLDTHGASIGETNRGLWHTVFPPGLERGFYIEMGGFELVSALSGGGDLPGDFKGRVTPRGAIELARHGLLPEVSLELINDQSKSEIGRAHV